MINNIMCFPLSYVFYHEKVRLFETCSWSLGSKWGQIMAHDSLVAWHWPCSPLIGIFHYVKIWPDIYSRTLGKDVCLKVWISRKVIKRWAVSVEYIFSKISTFLRYVCFFCMIFYYQKISSFFKLSSSIVFALFHKQIE